METLPEGLIQVSDSGLSDAAMGYNDRAVPSSYSTLSLLSPSSRVLRLVRWFAYYVTSVPSSCPKGLSFHVLLYKAELGVN